jgi:putative hydrolase of the HAD superfamily
MRTPVPEPTAVIFDLDDTLYPERRFALSGYAAVAAQIATETGMPDRVIYRFLVRRFRRAGRDGLLQALCASFALSATDIPRYVDTIRTHAPRLRYPARSREVLAALRARGHRIGVLTNGLPSTQRGKVAALGLDSDVDAIVYAQECAPDGKPARVCFTTALGRLGVAAPRAVFVGDHPEKDIAGAQAAGLRTVWLPGRAPATAATGPDAVAGRLDEVPALVDRLLEDADGTQP